MLSDSEAVMMQQVILIGDKSTELALATLDYSRPYVSAMGFVFRREVGELGFISVILSDLAQHAKNIQRNLEVSCLIMEPGEKPIHDKMRFSFICKADILMPGKDDKKLTYYRTKYIERYPTAVNLLKKEDVRFYELNPFEVRWVMEFGKYRVYVKRQHQWLLRTDVDAERADREGSL